MSEDEPRLARRRANKHSKIKSGRTIGERREHLETKSERFAARKKVKNRQKLRVITTVFCFLAVFIVAVVFIINFIKQREENAAETVETVVSKTFTPTIEIIDENNAGSITARMSEYIGQIEADFREKGLTPLKAVIPAGSIRGVNFYLDGVTGFIKTTIDRGAGVTTEDAERMLRYLTSQGISDFTYIDVRIDGKAYWK